MRLGLWLAFAALTKSEGLPLAALLLALGAFAFRRRLLLALAPVAIAAGSLLLWRTWIERSDENPFASLVFQLPAHGGRFALFLQSFAEEIVRFSMWGGLGLAFLAALLWLVRRRRWTTVGAALAMMVPMLLLYAAVVAVTDWTPDVMIDLAPRLLTHLLGPVFFTLAAAWWEVRAAVPGLPAQFQ